MFTGVRTYTNGKKEAESFEEYEDMIRWLAEDPETGVAGYENDVAMPQNKLVDDILAWRNL